MEFLHYTSTEAAQSINAGRRLRPGSGGRIYLTPDAYDSGTDAVARLGLLGKPVEFCADLGDEKFVYKN